MDVTSKIGRIKSILRPFKKNNPKILKRVLSNFPTLQIELSDYWSYNQYTNLENIGVEFFDVPTRGFHGGIILSKVGTLINCKIMCKTEIDPYESPYPIQGYRIFGDTTDISLCQAIASYLISATYLYTEYHKKKKIKLNRYNRLNKIGIGKKEDARSYASDIRSNTLYKIYKELDILLEMKPASKKEAIILKFIYENTKIEFSDKSGPKVSKCYTDTIDWNKAITRPEVFQENKLIN